ncbi:MAG: carboxylesterase/lipase family protein [Clostridia bacterium]|nr:carboxylesterase/lipase family protein [Clostridia bacterium]
MKSLKKALCIFLSLIIISACILPVFAETVDDAPVAQTVYGAVKGKNYNGGECYFGVPYAKATTGSLRFTPPVAPDNWDGVLDTTEQPKDPVQTGYSKSKQSEDSLKLNIWVPDTESSEPLAVMFWIYGGSYATGGINESYYDMETMANDTGCIIISANYRLNVCGFLDLRDVIPGATANNGLRDIVFALEWVNANIASFGGDPTNVTVFGQSSGAALATALLAVPTAKPYFSKIISQSACGDSFYSPEQAKDVASMWLDSMGNPSAEELETMDAKKLVSKNGKLDVDVALKYGINCTFNPVIDGEFLVCHPSQAAAENTDKKILAGCTENEASLFFFFIIPPLTLIPIVQNLVTPNYDDSFKSAVIKGMSYPSTKAFIELGTERMYRYPLTTLADNYSETTDVYTYRYDYQPRLVKFVNLGAFHITDIPILFNSSLDLGLIKTKIFSGETDMQVGSRMRTYWGNFAKYGCPHEDWTQYDKDNRATLIIDETDSMVNNPYGERMSVYENYVSPWNK